MDYLTEIELNFPSTDTAFFDSLKDFLQIEQKIPQEPEGLLPSISLKQLEKKNLSVGFCTNNECLSVEVRNLTDKEWKSKYSYEHIALSDVVQRLGGTKISSIDHLGINFPWQEGIHPMIMDLRERLKAKCLYHLFPSGEPWDFIIPGTREEITENSINYALERKPKFEIVSFDGCSTPLVQIDASIDIEYMKLKAAFPEAIALDDIKALWIYLKTGYDFDVCIILNQRGEGWTSYFKDHRLS